MKYFCIEYGKLISVLDYHPNVPSSVQVVEVSDQDFTLIENKTHYFDLNTNTVVPNPQSVVDRIEQEKKNDQYLAFLDNTDWKVLRHIREKVLGAQTTLTEEEYLDLEEQRATAASSIIK